MQGCPSLAGACEWDGWCGGKLASCFFFSPNDHTIAFGYFGFLNKSFDGDLERAGSSSPLSKLFSVGVSGL
ncbi:hypothetical protein BDDG_12378 [Blastomyces dermatitidis ATCC 18188]|uniref:Uncharacterized protein n=1 Tax=Ajellomyces dermatitidis (strain ATCC 18188 / CBS 674.68) TaxID=653446 RepID=A0A0J9EP79_AJEDA|nr:hypothetical protein BDDG_12378 [Blastomyces dermatitidis ATCC 18188]